VLERVSYVERNGSRCIVMALNFPLFRSAVTIILERQEQTLENQVKTLKEIVLEQRREIRLLKEKRDRGFAWKVWALGSTFNTPSSWVDFPEAILELDVLRDNADVKFSINFSATG